ncbi:MAG: transporter [Nitrospirae bacterium]|nr:transporter [Nitrospirota bacterium]
MFVNSISFAAHPLITDDAGTQGKGKMQLEINSEFGYDKERDDDVTTKETGVEVAAIVSYGINDNIDVVLGLPYQWAKTKEDGETVSDEDGIADMSLEVKWRLYESDGLSFALKPGLTFPTGDEEKGLGNGRASYGITFITTKEIEPWAFHLNLAYSHNEYKLEEDKDANRKDIWHVSLASQVEVAEKLSFVANIGVKKNADKASNTHPAFILGGLIYSLSENVDIDFGCKAGLNKPETDYSILAGINFRF